MGPSTLTGAQWQRVGGAHGRQCSSPDVMLSLLPCGWDRGVGVEGRPDGIQKRCQVR